MARMGLFRKVGDTLPNRVASIQEKPAERGKKAAEAYKTMDKILNQQAQGEEALQKEIEKKPIMRNGESRTILFPSPF